MLSYQARERIGTVLTALRAQDFDAKFEVLVVDSGTDGCHEYVSSNFPEVRIVRASERLRPGPARNRGVAAAQGDVVAFAPDDGTPRQDWLRRRVELHDSGFEAVGGAITNGRPESYVATAGHLLEYSALFPDLRILRAQEVPHCLSFSREILERLGPYPEDTFTGEDTLFNSRCIAAGVNVGFSADIQMSHAGHTSLRGTLRHAFQHGQGLMQCSTRHGLGSVIGSPQSSLHATWRTLVIYPAAGLAAKVHRFQSHAPELMPLFLKSLPVIYLALLATGAGALSEWRHQGKTGVKLGRRLVGPRTKQNRQQMAEHRLVSCASRVGVQGHSAPGKVTGLDHEEMR